MKVDKEYCMSSFLTFRYIFDENVTFKKNISRSKYQIADTKYLCETADDIDAAIRDYFKDKIDSHTGIMLSGGMDSATLATYMPEGTKAYTLKSMVDGALDESQQAKEYAEICGLDHRIVEIYWEDYEKYNKGQGFALNPDTVYSGGEKILNLDEFCLFIHRISVGEDKLFEQRKIIKELSNVYTDCYSSKRVCDFILSNLEAKNAKKV